MFNDQNICLISRVVRGVVVYQPSLLGDHQLLSLWIWPKVWCSRVARDMTPWYKSPKYCHPDPSLNFYPLQDEGLVVRGLRSCALCDKLHFAIVNIWTSNKALLWSTSLKSLRLRKLLDKSVLALLGPSLPFLVNFYWPYWALLSLIGPYWALLGLNGPYWALLGLTGPY